MHPLRLRTAPARLKSVCSDTAREANHFERTVKITEGIVHPKTLRDGPICLKPFALTMPSAVEQAGLSGLREGQKVEYEVVPGRNGKSSAENLVVSD